MEIKAVKNELFRKIERIHEKSTCHIDYIDR